MRITINGLMILIAHVAVGLAFPKVADMAFASLVALVISIAVGGLLASPVPMLGWITVRIRRGNRTWKSRPT
jgi:hypothetical protein